MVAVGCDVKGADRKSGFGSTAIWDSLCNIGLMSLWQPRETRSLIMYCKVHKGTVYLLRPSDPPSSLPQAQQACVQVQLGKRSL